MTPITMTLTEALAELKLIDNKIKSKSEFVLRNLYRNKALVDPLAEEGGSTEAVSAAIQSMKDLRLRKIKIRSAINVANQTHSIHCGGTEKTIEEWLIWRRLVFPEMQGFMHGVVKVLHQARTSAAQVGNRLQAAQVQSADDIIVHLKEKEFVEDAEQLQEVYDKLDGLLSLKNAQITIEV